MHHLRTLAACAFATLLVACASEPAVAPPAVHAEGRTRMPVVGLQGWQQGRVVRYGEFSTSPVGAPSVSQKVTPCPAGCSTLEAGAVRRAFDSTARSSASSLSFTQFGPGERSVRVHVTLSAQAQNAGWATTLFGVPVDGGGGRVVTSEFAGLVEAADGSRPAWRFALLQDTRTDGVDRPAGWARGRARPPRRLRPAAAWGRGCCSSWTARSSAASTASPTRCGCATISRPRCG